MARRNRSRFNLRLALGECLGDDVDDVDADVDDDDDDDGGEVRSIPNEWAMMEHMAKSLGLLC